MNDPSRIRSRSDYLALFACPEKALDRAHDLRKFEIEHYWKRAAYFWAIIAGVSAGYVYLSGAEDAARYARLFTALVGLVLSVAWYRVNRGSKYWQLNWERHVDLLEDEVTGPLHKTTISRDDADLNGPLAPYPYSVSGINIALSLFVASVWVGLIVIEVGSLVGPKIPVSPLVDWGVILGSVTWCGGFCVWFSRLHSRSENAYVRVDFTRRAEESDPDVTTPGTSNDE